MCLGHERIECSTHERLAPGEAELGGTQRTRLGEHPKPFIGAQFVTASREIDGVGAVETLKRAPIGDLRQEPERVTRPVGL